MNLFSPVLWLIAFRSLFQHRLRTNLLGIAITIVTTLFVLAVGIFSGIEDTLVVSATTLVSGHVNVAGFYKANSSQAAPLVTQYKRSCELVKTRGAGDRLHRPARPRLRQAGGRERLDAGGHRRHRHRRRAGLQEGGDRALGLASTGSPRTTACCCSRSRPRRFDAKVGDRLTLAAPTPARHQQHRRRDGGGHRRGHRHAELVQHLHERQGAAAALPAQRGHHRRGAGVPEGHQGHAEGAGAPAQGAGQRAATG